MLEELWAIEQIKQLKARYCRLLDAKDWPAFEALFTADCVHETATAAGFNTVDNNQYFAGVRRALGQGKTIHQTCLPEIDLLSLTDATGMWAGFDYVQLGDGGVEPVATATFSRYYERYRHCSDGAWRISSKRNERLHTEVLHLKS